MAKLNQWKITSDVINWFTNIPDMQKHSFASFDIDSFDSSITVSSLWSNFICQEIYHNQRQRHRHNYALPEITFIWQRDRLDQEKPQQHVRRNYGQLRRSGSLWAYRTFPPEQPQREIRQKQRRTLQRRRAGTFKKRKRTTIRTD